MKTGLSKKRKDSIFVILMLLPSILMLLTFTYYPMIKGSMMAFQNYNLMNINKIEWNGFANFQKLFTDPGSNFGQTVLNTVVWVVLSLLFQFVLGFGLALLLKKKFRGSAVYQGLIFFPWAVSGFIIGIMWRWMFNGTSGVINDILLRVGIISSPVGWLASSATALPSVIVSNVWYGVPFFTIMITAALRGVSQDMYEAADVDGASAITKFFKITLPSVKSVLLMTVLLRVIWIFNFPDLIYSMTGGGPGGSSNIITSLMVQKVHSLDYGAASAIGLLCILFLSVYTIFYLAFSRIANQED